MFDICLNLVKILADGIYLLFIFFKLKLMVIFDSFHIFRIFEVLNQLPLNFLYNILFVLKFFLKIVLFILVLLLIFGKLSDLDIGL